MGTMLLDTLFSAIKFFRLRWEFMVTLVVALTFLTLAAISWNMGLAMVGAIAAFAAGEARAGQVLCNECAVDMVITDPEIPVSV
jgi:hypothetical protein